MKVRKIYKTAMGKELDIHNLTMKNEKAIALGNANLNARGDQIDAKGKIVRKREQLAQDYYRANPKAVRDEILEEDNLSDKFKLEDTTSTENTVGTKRSKRKS